MNLLNPRLQKGYFEKQATLEEVKALYNNFITPIFGDQVLSVDTAQTFQKNNADALRLVFEEGNEETPIGFYSIIPINQRGIQWIAEHDNSGAKLNEEHLAPSKDNSSGYIAGVAAFGLRARVATISFAYSFGIKFKEVLSVPVSEDGLHWVKKLGCEPYYKNKNGLKEIYTWSA